MVQDLWPDSSGTAAERIFKQGGMTVDVTGYIQRLIKVCFAMPCVSFIRLPASPSPQAETVTPTLTHSHKPQLTAIDTLLGCFWVQRLPS